MLNTISIKSFKSFKNKDISVGRLNILTGLNNAGKSTVLQALRMCASSGINSGTYLEGLGNYAELRSKYSGQQETISLILKNQNRRKISSVAITEQDFKFSKTKDIPHFEYVSADRYGPRVSLPIIKGDYSTFSVGEFGECSAHYARIFENSIVSPILRHKGSVSHTLQHQLIQWMGEISPGVKLDFDVATRYDSSSIAVDGNRSTNSGYGLSYSLPIVLALLTLTGEIGADDSNVNLKNWFEKIKRVGAILVIENPEAHLHPRGQTNMGILITLAAATGLQIFIETHSDHVLDGIRLGVKELNNKEQPDGITLKGSDVKIKFFSKKETVGTEIEEINLLNNGKIERWPAGFFDQFSLNLRALSSKNDSN